MKNNQNEHSLLDSNSGKNLFKAGKFDDELSRGTSTLCVPKNRIFFSSFFESMKIGLKTESQGGSPP